MTTGDTRWHQCSDTSIHFDLADAHLLAILEYPEMATHLLPLIWAHRLDSQSSNR